MMMLAYNITGDVSDTPRIHYTGNMNDASLQYTGDVSDTPRIHYNGL